MRVGIYARYSSDLQTMRSIEDQLAVCKEKVADEGWTLSGTYTDAATSGASMLRPGLQDLLSDASLGKFDLVLCEALDRLSRNQADIARIYEQLTFHGVKLVTLSEGVISELHIGLKGTMNALFLKDLADKTRRGLKGRIQSGKSAGGKAYSYKIPLKFNELGEKVTGEMVIDDAEAKIITRIFEMYAAGISPRAIAHTLNAEGLKGPNGKAWGPSTINGNRRRGTGIINNELYIGTRIWNRLAYRKDPSTGKRVSRLNPESDWIREEVPSLKIISEYLWQSVKARQKALDTYYADGTKAPFHSKQRARYFWSGKVKCGHCGGSYSKISKDLLGCATSRNKGMSECSNRKNIRVDMLEQELLSGLQHHLMTSEHFEIFIDAFTQELNRLSSARSGNRHVMEARLIKVEGQLEKAVDAILNGADAVALNTRMKELEAEKAELEVKLASINEESNMLLHPNMSRLYKEKVTKLSEALSADPANREAFEAIRSILDMVTLHPTDDGFHMDIEGDLASILALSSNSELSSAAGISSHALDTTKPSDRLIEGSDELALQVKLVAGVGLVSSLCSSSASLRYAKNLGNLRFGRILQGANPYLTGTQKHESHPIWGGFDVLVAGVGFEPTTFRL